MSRDPQLRFVHREIVLLTVLVAVTIAAFFITRAVATGNRRIRTQDAEAWYAEGQSAARNADLERAVTAFRQAAIKDADNIRYRLALAQALARAHHDDQARRTLLALRDLQPEDPDTNLQLARLERSTDPDAAIRYYQSTLVEWWRPDRLSERRDARTELIQYLLDRGDRSHALAELLVLVVDLPDDGDAQSAAGRLFLAAGDPRRALERFTAALRLAPGSAAAHAGAGEAHFELGEYAQAIREFADASSLSTRSQELMQVSQLVLSADPLAPRLSSTERKRRLKAALAYLKERLGSCGASPPPAQTADLESLRLEIVAFDKTITEVAARDLTDTIEEGLNAIARTERALEGRCGSAPPLDRALGLITRRHGIEG